MITILGLDSQVRLSRKLLPSKCSSRSLSTSLQVCMMEGLFTALEDTFPFILRKHKKVSLALTCFGFFLLGIPMVTNVGFACYLPDIELQPSYQPILGRSLLAAAAGYLWCQRICVAVRCVLRSGRIVVGFR